MIEDNISELGVDINHNWDFKDGDLTLVDNETNLVQSILNRLNCEYDSLDTYYFEYGTDLSSFLGFRSNQETLEFIKIEVETTLNQDPRLNDFNVEVEYNKKGLVSLFIIISFNDESELDLSLIINEEGTVIIDEEGLSNEDINEEEE